MDPRDGYEYESENNTLTDDSADYSDTYDEKSGKSAVGRLFDDETEDRTPTRRVAPRTVVPTAPTTTALPDDDDYLSALSKNREARGDRSRPPAPTARKVERSSVRNPEPRPAVRANVAVTREPVRTRQVNDDYSDPPLGEDVDNFKNRYGNRDALGTARDPGTVDKHAPDDRVLHPVGAKSRPRPMATAAPAPADYGNINPIKWLFLLGIVVVIIVMIVLMVQNSRMSRELDELRAQGATGGAVTTPTPDNGYADYPTPDLIQYQMQVQSLLENVDELNADIATLEQGLWQAGIDPEAVRNPPPQATPMPEPDPTPPPRPPAYIVHYVQQGQTLGGIATLHLGAFRYYPLIIAFNNMPNANIHQGQRLLIPLQP